MSRPGAGPLATLVPADAAAPRALGGRRPRAWWLLLTGRVILLALAAAGSAFALFAADREPPPSAAVRYRCPMHPDAVAAHPATCPVCGMALVLDEALRRAAAPRSREPAARVARAARRRFAEPIRAPAWVGPDGGVVALLYRDDLIGLRPGQPAQFVAARAQAVEIGVVLGGEPPTGWDRETARAVFVASPGASGAPSPAEHGTIVIAPVARDLLVVPSSAIVQTADGPCAFVIDPASHRAVRRAVSVGREHRDVTAVTAGLADGDVVVVTGAFFVAAEHDLHPEDAP
jgi:hypothetical protein